MFRYKIHIHLYAVQDIQDATDWYNEQLKGLGTKFQQQVKTQINSLKRSPFTYSIRYDLVRCMMIKKFPFLLHYTVHEEQKLVEIFAVFHTSRNPKIWKRTKVKL